MHHDFFFFATFVILVTFWNNLRGNVCVRNGFENGFENALENRRE